MKPWASPKHRPAFFMGVPNPQTPMIIMGLGRCGPGERPIPCRLSATAPTSKEAGGTWGRGQSSH
jgi:hypothetical protein